MAYTTIFANLPGSPATNPASLIDGMFNRVGQIAVVPCDAAGTNAITLTPQANTPPITAYTNHTPVFSSIAANTSTGLVTMQVGGLAFVPVFLPDAATQAGVNDIKAGRLVQFVFESSLGGGTGGFILISAAAPPTNTGAINGSVQIKTTNYTVTNNDKGATITVTNNQELTILGGAASGYDANFQVRIINGNTTAALAINFSAITVNGFNNFLYPGQSIVIQNINSVWTLAEKAGRWLKANPIVFVDVNGNDVNNDGLAAGVSRAFATIAGAYSFLTAVVDGQNTSGTIQLTSTQTNPAGASSNGLTFAEPTVGRMPIIINGDNTSTTTAANYTINVNAGFTLANVKDLSHIIFRGVHLTTGGSGSTGVQAIGGARCDLDTIVFGGFGGGICLSYGTNANGGIQGSCRLDGACVAFVSATGNSYIQLGTGPAAANMTLNIPSAVSFTTFAQGQSGGVVDNSFAQYTGAGSGTGSTGQRWTSTTAGGIIFTTTTFPGTVAGAATSPGWFT